MLTSLSPATLSWDEACTQKVQGLTGAAHFLGSALLLHAPEHVEARAL